MIRKKPFFTLLEILVVIFILSIGAIAIAFKFREAYEEQRFLSEVSQVVSDLNLAQDLMLLMDTDVTFRVRVNTDEHAIEYWIEPEKPLTDTPLKKKKGDLQKKILRGIESIFLEPSQSGGNNELDIIFSRGKSTEGTLILSPRYSTNNNDKEGENDYIISLLGYPHPIESQHATKEHSSNQENKQGESERLYPRGNDD